MKMRRVSERCLFCKQQTEPTALAAGESPNNTPYQNPIGWQRHLSAGSSVIAKTLFGHVSVKLATRSLTRPILLCTAAH